MPKKDHGVGASSLGVTPEMISSGAEVVSRYFDDRCSGAEDYTARAVAIRVFLAMLSARDGARYEHLGDSLLDEFG